MKNIVLEKWEQLKKENPKLRIRDAAKLLNLSEAELVAAGVGSYNVALNSDFRSLLKEIEKLGVVMALTRNDNCVHERRGIYKKVGFNGDIGLVVNLDIDLRLFMSHWKFGFAVNENGRLSFQFFDKGGDAVHKIYLTELSDKVVFTDLINKYRAQEQLSVILTEPYEDSKMEKRIEDIDVSAFQKAWTELGDTHDFHGMLKTYGVSRRQAMDLAPKGFAEILGLTDLKRILESVAARRVEIMVFTGSRGCIQIHTGEVKNLVQTGPWYNVLDPLFNMHLREDGIASVWQVKKPTKDGIVTSLEVLDYQGGLIVQFFGKRKPGIPESEEWRAVLDHGVELV